MKFDFKLFLKYVVIALVAGVILGILFDDLEFYLVTLIVLGISFGVTGGISRKDK